MIDQLGADPPPHRRGSALWPLALGAGLLPLVATLLAFQLSARLELIPSCNPFFDGCASISRAARHDAPNAIFRAMVAPAAVLQAACWLLCPAWLRSLRAPRERWLSAVPWLGVLAGACMLLYVTALGVDGPWYRFMRRYGVVFYFGFTCIDMLIVSGQMHRLGVDRRVQRGPARALLALCAALPLLGLVYVFGALALDGPEARDALENITEWWAGAIFTLFFLALAWAWRVSGFAARLGSGAGAPP